MQKEAKPATQPVVEEKSKPFQVVIKMLFSNGEVVLLGNVDATDATTVEELGKTIQSQCKHAPKELFRFIWRGRMLERDRQLSDYGVKDLDLILLAGPLRGS